MMERTLRESEGKYRSIFELAPVAIATVDLKGVITSCNTLVTSSGYSRDAIIGKHFSKVGWLQMKDLPKYLQMFSSIIRGKVPEPFEVNYRYKDGEPHVGEAYVSLTKQNGKITGIQTIMRDITERKKRERAIQQNQQKFRRLFMDNPEAAVHMDSSFHILDINPRFTKLFGYSLDEVKGRHINDAVVPEDRMEEAERFDKKASRGEAYHEDTVRKRRDGTLVPVSFSAAPIIVEDKVTGHVAIYKDISQLKSTEKALKETMGKLAVMNEKLRVVGRLTRHDIRNKLSAVTGNVFIAKRKLADGHELLENLNETELACQQVVRILDFARTYEMLGIEELTYMNVEKIVGEAVQLFPDLHDVKVVNDCRGLTVLTDSLLRQLFYNMIHNSLKHGGKVSRIRVYCEETEKDRLKLVYEDDGVGIPKSEKEKIFREGYGKGTGYGLYLIRKMSEVYGWTIRETGKHGKNVEFIITIPKMNRNGKRNYRFS
jgi:PAS domain S-box-containing protein